MNYSINPAMVRVDIFKPSGKWHVTIAIRWLTYSGKLIHDAFREAVEADEYAKNYLKPYDEGGSQWVLVCLEPYHENAHPIILGLDYDH